MKKKAAKGSTRKHASKKHHATRGKHHPTVNPGGPMVPVGGHPVHVVARHVKHHKKVGLALAPGDVACCAAEALAASLRLAGGAVSPQDVLNLYWHTAGDPDAGATILATLEAACEHGLGGVQLVNIQALRPNLEFSGELFKVPCILGVDLPGAHAVTLGPDGAWWSWGEPYDPADFAGAVIEEAWAITWAPLTGEEVVSDVSFNPLVLQ